MQDLICDGGETIEATRLIVKRDKFEFKSNLTHKEKGVQVLRVHTSIILIFA
jgi:hypothetical protein